MRQSKVTIGEHVLGAPPVDGAPSYPRRKLRFPLPAHIRPRQLSGEAQRAADLVNGEHSFSTVDVVVDAFQSLAPADAVGLLDGVDETGTMVWDGAVLGADFFVRHLAAASLGEERAAAASLAPWTTEGRLLAVAEPFPDRANAAELYEALRRPVRIIVELGSGAGATSVAAAKACAAATSSGVLPAVVATDGNPACVELAERNGQLNLAAGGTPRSGAHAAVEYQWGPELPTALSDAVKASLRQGSAAGATSALLVAADVIYSAEAVPPLLQAVAALTEAMPTGPLLFLLSFMPRCWTDSVNEENCETIRSALSAAGWRLLGGEGVVAGDLRPPEPAAGSVMLWELRRLPLADEPVAATNVS